MSISSDSENLRSHGAVWLARAAVLGLWAVVSRLLGLMRDLGMAWLIGAGGLADALVAATLIPHACRKLLGDGVLSIPVTAASAGLGIDDPHTSLQGVFGRCFPFLAVISVCLCAVVFLPAEFFADCFARIRNVTSGYSAICRDEDSQYIVGTCATLIRLACPYLATVLFSAVAMGLLHTQGRMSAASGSSVCFNLCILSCMAVGCLVPQYAAYCIACGFALGGIIQSCWLWLAIARNESRLAKRAEKDGSSLASNVLPSDVSVVRGALVEKLAKKIRRGLKSLPCLALAASGLPLAVFAAMVPAAMSGEGEMTALYFADRVLELPVGIIGTCMGVVALADFSRSAAEQKTSVVWEQVCSILHWGLLFSLPAAFGLAAICPLMTQVLFGRGLFDTAALHAVERCLYCMIPALPACVFLRTLVGACHALGLNRFAAFSSLTASLVTLFIGIVGCFVFPGQAGIAPLTASLTLWGQAFFVALQVRSVCGQGRFALASQVWPFVLGSARLVFCGCSAGLAALLPFPFALPGIVELGLRCVLGALAWLVAVCVLFPTSFASLKAIRHSHSKQHV